MPCKMLDEITSPFPNFNSCTDEVCEYIKDLILHFIMDVSIYAESLVKPY